MKINVGVRSQNCSFKINVNLQFTKLIQNKNIWCIFECVDMEATIQLVTL